MSGSSVHASEDTQEKTTDPFPKNGIAETRSTVSDSNPEYDRYLELHRQFAGAGEKKLLRKRSSSSSIGLMSARMFLD